MPPTRPGASIIGHLFFHRACRTWLGGLPGNVRVLRPFPMLWRVLGHPRMTLGRHAASIMSTRRACSGPSGVGRRKPMLSEVRRGTGRPQISARTRAMMLMMLTGRPHRRLPRTRAAEAAGRGTKQDGTRALACTSCQGGKGRRRDQRKGRRREWGGGPARARARPAPLLRALHCPPPNE